MSTAGCVSVWPGEPIRRQDPRTTLADALQVIPLIPSIIKTRVEVPPEQGKPETGVSWIWCAVLTTSQFKS